MRTHIAGVSYRPIECQAAFTELKDGDELELIPEPDNPYDPNAIKVMKGEFHLGYVPAKLAAQIVNDLPNLTAYWNEFDLFPMDEGYMSKNLVIDYAEAAIDDNEPA